MVDPEQKAPADTPPVVTPAAASSTKVGQLIGLLGDHELFKTPEQQPFITFTVEDHLETHPLNSSSVRHWLGRLSFDRLGLPASRDLLEKTLEMLGAQARFSQREYGVYVRVAGKTDRAYLDLTDDKWQVVEIADGAWKVVSSSPVKFRRVPAMKPLPAPARGGSFEALWRFVNVPLPQDRILVASFLVAALRPTGPYPVLVLSGEQGSAKSTTARVLRELIDPNKALLRSDPHAERDVLIAATNGWLLAFDNLSRLEPWLSDCLCRVSTGAGDSARALYTDSDEAVLSVQRPVLLNGIEELATRADLLDRSIIIELPSIPGNCRRPEGDLWAEFQKERPHILGALLDAVALGMRDQHTVAATELPRMADFARFAMAAMPAFGWTARDFLAAYGAGRESANRLALESSPVGLACLALMEGSEEWRGTTADLLARLNQIVSDDERRDRAWPRTPRALTSCLVRISPNLRALGVRFEKLPRTGFSRPVRLSRLAGNTVTTVTTVIQHAGVPNARDEVLGSSVKELGDRHEPDGKEPLCFDVSKPRTDGRDGRDDLPGDLVRGSPAISDGAPTLCASCGSARLIGALDAIVCMDCHSFVRRPAEQLGKEGSEHVAAS